MDYDELLKKAMKGVITSEEVKKLAQNIEVGTDGEYLYEQLHILGHSLHYEYEDLVASYLVYKKDPMISGIAIEVLCGYWHKTKKYLDYIKQFVKKVDWDEADDIRIIAISFAGVYLRENSDKELLKSLLDIFNNSDEKSVVRECAYRAIMIACGKNWKELPSVVKDLDFNKDVDKEIIEWAERQVEDVKK
jgi:hypothetical protein